VFECDLLIVGMGIAGLATAVALAKKGKRVAICDRRTNEFKRWQHIILTPESIRTLSDLQQGSPSEVETQFLYLLRRERGITAIKDIQRYLYKQLLRLQQSGNPVIILTNANIDSITTDKQGNVNTIKISSAAPPSSLIVNETRLSQVELKVQNLICSDGYTRDTFYLLCEQSIDFKPAMAVAAPLYYPHHASLNVSIQRVDNQPLVLPRNPVLRLTDQNRFRVLVLRTDSAAKFKEPRTKIKAHYVTEMPQDPADGVGSHRKDSVRKLLRKDIVDNLCKLNGELSVTLNTSEADSGCQFFTTPLMKMERPMMHNVICIGDCFLTSRYALSHGANDAIKEAVLVRDLLTGDITKSKFEQQMVRLASSRIQEGKIFDEGKSAYVNGLPTVPYNSKY